MMHPARVRRSSTRTGHSSPLAAGGCISPECREVEIAGLQQRQSAARRAGADAGQQLQDPEGGHAVARVLGQAQEREQILDVRRLDELQAAELDERDVAPPELQLEPGAVMPGAEQHRLLAQLEASLAVSEHLLHDIVDLLVFARHRNQARPVRSPAYRAQALGVALRGQLHDGIGGVQDRLGRAIVLLEPQHRGGRREMTGEVEDVAHGRGAKAVDRLGVVADHGETAPIRLEPQQDFRLKRVGILIFVDQDEIEAARHVRGDRSERHHVRPVQQQIVVIEHPLRALG